MEWKTRIGELILIKQALHQIDPSGLWEYTLPEVAATESRLQATEAALGESLDTTYREFLAAAAGWRAFYQDVDLSGPAEFLQANVASTARWRRAHEYLSYLARDGVLATSDVAPADLVPIAVSARDIDVFVIGRTSSALKGQVLWFAKYEIDRFPSFEQYFLAMVEYNRLEFTDARERAGPLQ